MNSLNHDLMLFKLFIAIWLVPKLLHTGFSSFPLHNKCLARRNASNLNSAHEIRTLSTLIKLSLKIFFQREFQPKYSFKLVQNFNKELSFTFSLWLQKRQIYDPTMVFFYLTMHTQNNRDAIKCTNLYLTWSINMI